MNVSRPAQSVRWSSLSAHRSALGDQLTLSECDSACAERILPRIERMLTCTVAWDGERSSSGPACDDSAWTELSPACSLRLETKGKLLPALSRAFDDGGLLVRNRAECLLADRYRGSGMLPPASHPLQLVLSPGPPAACVALAALSCVTVAVAVFSAYDDFFSVARALARAAAGLWGRGWKRGAPRGARIREGERCNGSGY